jgi:hypothetical protein
MFELNQISREAILQAPARVFRARASRPHSGRLSAASSATRLLMNSIAPRKIDTEPLC